VRRSPLCDTRPVTQTKTRVPAVEGWFTVDPRSPALVGSRCRSCGTYAFPRQKFSCGNPACGSEDLEEVELSRRGKIWSYTDARYQPPAPYVAADPYEPFAIVAVELVEEKMVVMGQVVPGVGVEELSIGDEVEIALDTLYEDDENEYLVWKWRPVSAAKGADDA
jgi:uncharacterized protein